MRLTEVRINLCAPAGAAAPACRGHGTRLKAFCSLTFDNAFVVRDVKLIEGNDGLFLAMPSRKISDHCPGCGEKNHLRARFCNGCGGRLDEDRYLRNRNGNTHAAHGNGRVKLHADVAHPINADTRRDVEQAVLKAFAREVERSKQPGYVPPSLDGEDFDFYDDRPVKSADSSLRPVGAMIH